MKAGQRAQRIGQAYIFSCHGDLNHIAFPLTYRETLLGTVILGPFMMDEADSTLVSGLAEKYALSPVLSLELYDELSKYMTVEFDESGSIGKRYRRQDEIGTPKCIVIDFDTLEDSTVTVRDRDTMEQVRVPIAELKAYIAAKCEF